MVEALLRGALRGLEPALRRQLAAVAYCLHEEGAEALENREARVAFGGAEGVEDLVHRGLLEPGQNRRGFALRTTRYGTI